MRKEYDLSGGGRPNPYAKRIGAQGRKVLIERFLQSEKLVRLDDDVASAFADEASVNEALRLVLQLRAIATPVKAKRTRPAGARKAARRAA
jgi:hypothetical protein